MGRYKERETTSGYENLIPPLIYTFEIEDMRTGRFGKGAGYTKQEARDNAWKDLKFGEESKYSPGRAPSRPPREAPTVSSGGGGGGASLSLAGCKDCAIGCFTLLILFGFLLHCLDLLGENIDSKIKARRPNYETREEKISRGVKEWQRTKDFFAGSEKRFVVTEDAPAIPEGKLLVLGKNRSGKKGLFTMNTDGTNRTAITNSSVEVIDFALCAGRDDQIVFIADQKGKGRRICVLTQGSKKIGVMELHNHIPKSECVAVAMNADSLFVTVGLNPYMSLICRSPLLPTSTHPGGLEFLVPDLNTYNHKWVSEATQNTGYRHYLYCSSPSVSPSGEKLAYVRGRFGHRYMWWEEPIDFGGDLVVRDLRTRKETRIYNNASSSTTLGSQSWSPDGSRVAFGIKGGAGRDDLIAVKRLGRWPHNQFYLLRTLGQHPAWSPDGKWIAFDYNGEVFIIEVTNAVAKSEPRGGYGTGRQTPPLAGGNIVRVGAGERPLWVTDH